MTDKDDLLKLISEYKFLGIDKQVDYKKFYLYSLVTHSTAIEGSTMTEVENTVLFDDGIATKGKTINELNMNLDLKAAYERSMELASQHTPITIGLLKHLSSFVMRRTGRVYSTLNGTFDSSRGDLRLVNVTAGAGGKSYMDWHKVPDRLRQFCSIMESGRKYRLTSNDIYEKYLLSIDAHNVLVDIHPWVDGNGRMARLLMNHLQYEFGIPPIRVNKEDRAEYIQSLIDSHSRKDLEIFRTFMISEHIKNLRSEIAEYRKTNMTDDDILSKDELESIKKGLDDIKEGKLYKMKDNETLEEFIKRT
ncbi:MAG: Fic family protein [Prevotellaceae bacterium]|nr:Fic family protein [Prevotellaceae bacterium]